MSLESYVSSYLKKWKACKKLMLAVKLKGMFSSSRERPLGIGLEIPVLKLKLRYYSCVSI